MLQRDIAKLTSISPRQPNAGSQDADENNGIKKKRSKKDKADSEETAKTEVAPRRSSRAQSARDYSTIKFDSLFSEEQKPKKRNSVVPQAGGGSRGGRVYDSVNGTSCHQCRQKTMALKVCR